MPRKPSQTTPFKIMMAERAAEIMRLRRTTNMSLQAIADVVGMDRSNVHKTILKSIKNVLNREANELLVHELTRLQQIEDATVEAAFEWRVALDADGKAIYEPLFTADGCPVRDADGNQVVVPRRDNASNERAKLILLKTHEARCRLLGLQAPTKFQNVGGDAPESITFRVIDAREAPDPIAPSDSATIAAPAQPAQEPSNV
jgi:predicted DNA-binding protein YlxM (UPF0122 family)